MDRITRPRAALLAAVSALAAVAALVFAVPGPAAASSGCPVGASCEAEAAVFSSTWEIETQWCPCSAGASAGSWLQPGEWIRWTVDAPAAGSYVATFTHAAGDGATARSLIVNGGPAATVTFPGTALYSTWSTVGVPVQLSAGSNTIMLRLDGWTPRYVNLDRLVVTPAAGTTSTTTTTMTPPTTTSTSTTTPPTTTTTSTPAPGGPTLPAVPKVMSIGDSITNGISSQSISYRYQLQDRLRAAGCDYRMVGPNSGLFNVSGPVGTQIPGYDNAHAARAGDQSWHNQWHLPSWAATHRPDLVLIYIGHNDLYAAARDGRSLTAAITEATAQVERMVGQLRAVDPTVDVMVARITPSGLVPLWAFEQLNDSYAAAAARLTTSTSPVTVVDQLTGFVIGTDTADGVHPNQAGDAKIAGRWFDAMLPAFTAAGAC